MKRSGEEPSPLDRVLKALNHPLRRSILRELAAGAGSASTLSRTFKVDLGVVSYHLNRVLAEECEVIELVDTVPRRGSIEKFFELRVDSPPSLSAAAEPGGWDEVMWTLALGETLLKGLEARERQG